MAGFGFSFTDLTSGLASLNDIGERFNKIREDIESTLDKTLGAALPNDPQAEAAHQGAVDGSDAEQTWEQAADLAAREQGDQLEEPEDEASGRVAAERSEDAPHSDDAGNEAASSAQTGSQPVSTAASVAPVAEAWEGDEGWASPTFAKSEQQSDEDLGRSPSAKDLCGEPVPEERAEEVAEEADQAVAAEPAPAENVQQDTVSGTNTQGHLSTTSSVASSPPLASKGRARHSDSPTSDAGCRGLRLVEEFEGGEEKDEATGGDVHEALEEAALGSGGLAGDPGVLPDVPESSREEGPSHEVPLRREEGEEETHTGANGQAEEQPHSAAGDDVLNSQKAAAGLAEAPAPLDEPTSEEPATRQSSAAEPAEAHSGDESVRNEAESAAASPRTEAESGSSDAPSSQPSPDEDRGEQAPPLEQELGRLREALAAREAQAVSSAGRLAELTEVVEKLTRRNEELVLAASSVSEADVAALEQDFRQRLAAAERKAYAVGKERDALKKALEAKSALEAKLREKDETIAEVMAEGEKLSKKQLAQELTLKRLRAEAREAKGRTEDLSGRLAAAQQRVSELAAGLDARGADLAAEREQAAEVLAAERAAHAAALAEARAARDAAERQAQEAAKRGAAQRLRGSEHRVAVLEEALAELRAEAEAARAKAEEREELLTAEASALQRRCAVAEARGADADAAVQAATGPLLVQVRAMQAAAAEEAAAQAAAREAATRELEAAKEAAARLEARLAAAEEDARAARRDAAAAHAEADQARARAEAAHERGEAAAAAALAREREAAQARQEVAAAKEAVQTMEGLFREQARGLEARAVRAEGRVRELEDALEKSTQAAGPAADGARAPPSPEGGTSSAAATPSSLPASPRSTGAAEEASLRKSLREAEAVRDRLMEELVTTATAAELGKAAAEEAAQLRKEVDRLTRRCETCLVMLGEKDERIEELVADLSESRTLYRQQIEFMADRLAQLQAG